MTPIGGWIAEQQTVDIERKTKTTVIKSMPPVRIIAEYERAVSTREYHCHCSGVTGVPAEQNPGGLSSPWHCTCRRLNTPRGGYQEYREVWQSYGQWVKVSEQAG